LRQALLIAAVGASIGTAWRVYGDQADTCRGLRHHGKLKQAQACFESLSRSQNPFLSAEGFFGLARYDEANDQFRIAVKSEPKLGEIRTEWGNLYLEHYQPGDAAKLFEEALEIDPKDAAAYLGLARVAAERYDSKAIDLARKALQQDPKLYEAHELLAFLALEDSDTQHAADEAQKALALSNEALDGMAVLASIDWLNDKPESEWMQRILKINPVYGEAYATGAHFFEINRRYKEAIAYYRKALELNNELWPARSQLGVNLMRLGNQTEARQELERCYEAHYRDPETVNSLRLLDTLGDYETFRSGPAELLLAKKEAPLLRPYIEPELRRALATYERKYKMKLPGAVRLEVYPNHDDFMVRTLGLPGQGGLLGVTFGLVVTMDSPSARPPGEFNWASTMWHEMSHVYVLTATNHLVPRWFTEGLAVHEEGAVDPTWGNRLTPEIISALQRKQLLPVLELDRGFVRPKYPSQVLVSYYQAGKICDYISEKWGNDAILGMIHSYAARKTTAEAIQENLHQGPAAFDKDFNSWLDQKTGNTVRRFDDWKRGMKAAYANLESGKKDDAMREALAVRDYYPDYIAKGSAYELIATGLLAKNKKGEAMGELERYRDFGGANLDLLKKLATLEQEAGSNKQAENTLMKLIWIYPEDMEVHRMFGAILLKNGDANGAVREGQAALALHPADAADSHYQLAMALRAARRVAEAKDQVVLALEAAPDYKPAQQLLLQLSQ
jgi:tetratricopeptide (TPR) repeat protein